MVGVSDKAPRAAATVSVEAEIPEAPPVTETDGKNSGIVVAPRLAGVDVATAATPGTAVASEVTLSVSAPPSVVGVIVTPPAAEAVAESVPATPLPPPDHSCSSGTLSARPAQLLSSARNRSGATGAAPSSDDTSSDEEPLPQWKLVKSRRRKKRKNTEMSPSNTVSDSSPKSGCLVIETDSSFETF